MKTILSFILTFLFFTTTLLCEEPQFSVQYNMDVGEKDEIIEGIGSTVTMIIPDVEGWKIPRMSGYWSCSVDKIQRKIEVTCDDKRPEWSEQDRSVVKTNLHCWEPRDSGKNIELSFYGRNLFQILSFECKY